jgi:hypothetical protein
MDNFLDVLSGSFCNLTASLWATLRARLVLPDGTLKPFLPSVKSGKANDSLGSRIDEMSDVPDGIIAHLARKCSGNVHDGHIVDVTCGSFERVSFEANPHSGAHDNDSSYGAKNAGDLETTSSFSSAYRHYLDLPHTRNNWV